ncbi:MAG: winged helix-turn-helix domain-containing protein [Phycisphaerae bacterium]|jgi:hypothetical protein|nr:winged helix-turn-helix domain-containing protein [Phycisphaerae bacterium]GIK10598.1 MAG: hypothetical protein BroJett001_26640 [Chloroflexota bacterium]
MKKDEIKIGNAYQAKVSDRIVTVRIDSTNSHGGWNATNTATGKRIRIKSAQRLRRAVGDAAPTGRRSKKASAEITPADQGIAAARAEAAEPEVNPTVEVITGQPVPEKKKRTRKPAAEPKPKRVSALDAAAQVLADAGQPMRAKEMIEAMAERGLWSSPGGKTPEATLYAAIIREIATKGDAARFCKVERGQFTRAAV